MSIGNDETLNEKPDKFPASENVNYVTNDQTVLCIINSITVYFTVIISLIKF